ncbi:MAG: hypothetical protein ACKV1O_00345 [Saprospiraceae bacterium]
MVEITIYVEGALLEHSNHNAQMMGNSQRFRESFRRLFSSVFSNDDLRIVIQNGSGINQTVIFFKDTAIVNEQTILLVDLDAPTSKRDARIKEYGLIPLADRVFFMVQAMEAWILSQPDKIEQCFAQIKYGDKKIQEDENLGGISPDSIRNPARVLNTILSRYFRYQKQGKFKKLKYNDGKLKLAPDLIELLDFEGLVLTFEDVRLLQSRITEYLVKK